MVVTSGGVSMGEMDIVKPYVETKGQVYFGRLNMKPGKPTTFGKINKALVFALPGNPVSAFVTAHLFVVESAKLLAGQLDTAANGFQSLTV
jgi:gephyrin